MSACSIEYSEELNEPHFPVVHCCTSYNWVWEKLLIRLTFCRKSKSHSKSSFAALLYGWIHYNPVGSIFNNFIEPTWVEPASQCTQVRACRASRLRVMSTSTQGSICPPACWRPPSTSWRSSRSTTRTWQRVSKNKFRGRGGIRQLGTSANIGYIATIIYCPQSSSTWVEHQAQYLPTGQGEATFLSIHFFDKVSQLVIEDYPDYEQEDRVFDAIAVRITSKAKSIDLHVPAIDKGRKKCIVQLTSLMSHSLR